MLTTNKSIQNKDQVLFFSQFYIVRYKYVSMALHKTVVTPVLMHWSYPVLC